MSVYSEASSEVELLAVGYTEWTCESVRHVNLAVGSTVALALSPILGSTWSSSPTVRFRLETPQGFLEDEFIVAEGPAGSRQSVHVGHLVIPARGRHRVCLLDQVDGHRAGPRRSFLLSSSVVKEASAEEASKRAASWAPDAAYLDEVQATTDEQHRRFREASARQARAGKKDPLSRGLDEPEDVYLMRTELYTREAAALDAMLDQLMVNSDTGKKEEL